METKIQVEGMSCGHCKAAVTKAVEGVDGVQSVNVDLDTGQVVYSGVDVDLEKIRQSVAKAGFKVK